jgi:ribonucleotide reductase alpha subunit
MIDYSADRGSYIDQSQSFNVYMEEPTISKLSSAYLYSWEKGLKTCQYYLRIRPKAKAISFTIDPTIEKKRKNKKNVENSVVDNTQIIGINSPINFEMSREQSVKEEEVIEELVCRRDNPDCLSCGS